MRTEQFKSPLHKISDGPSVRVQATAGKTLVGAVKEGEVVLTLDDVRNLGPLVLGGVHACGIVCACVEDDDRPGGGGLQILDETIEIQRICLGIIVSVLPDILEPGILENKSMIAPGRIAVVGNILDLKSQKFYIL